MAALAAVAELAAGAPSAAAAEAARRLANAELAAHGFDATDAPSSGEFPRREVAASLRKHRSAWDGGGAAKMAEWAARAAGDAVGNAANRQMLRHGRGDVRFARVPSGPRACPWCVAIASQGFVYSSSEKAGEFASWHDNCRCRVLPSVDAAIEGYDPDEYLRICRADERIGRMGLPEKVKDALRAAYRDSYMGGHTYGREELERLLDDGAKGAFSAFRKDKTHVGYRKTIQTFFEEIGNAYGFSLVGETIIDKNGGFAGASLDGKELCAAIVLASGTGRTLIKVNAERGGGLLTPDFLTNGCYVDVKTPASVKKVRERLWHAHHQIEAVCPDLGEAILDVTHLGIGKDKGIDIARDLYGKNLFLNVFIIDGWDFRQL
ncbi:hypothetical protein AALA69_07625 [Eggerthellaceae bacterium 24-137]